MRGWRELIDQAASQQQGFAEKPMKGTITGNQPHV